ncbi:interaptin-like [Mytilus trossulus]|uniref:interaptin-like n=1 Tax=Mytilus trossulus TaxID=6551 RepID=UPI0030060D25
MKDRAKLMKKEAEVHVVKMKEELAKSSTIINEIENNHLPEIENQAKYVVKEIKLAITEVNQVINSKSDMKITNIEGFKHLEEERLKIDLANRKHIHNRCSEVKYSFEKLIEEKHALTFLTAYTNLIGKIVDFEDIDQGPNECKPPPQFDRNLFVEDLIDGITSQFEKSESAQIKPYHFHKDQLPRLIKENERLKLSEKQSKEILEQIDEEMKSLKDTTKILITNTESLHDLLSDMGNKLKLSEQQSKQLLEKKEQELKTLEDTNEATKAENETLHDLLNDIERQLRLSEKQSEDVLERKDKEIKRLEDTNKVIKVEKESLQDQLSDIQSRIKLSRNQYKDVLEEKEIELKRLEDRFKISETESKEKERNRLEDNQNLLEAEKQSLQDLLNKSDNKFKLSEKQFKQILEENGKEIKRLQDTHIVMKAEKRSLQDLLNDIKSQLEKEKLKSKEWVKLSEIHSKEILEKKERQFKRLEAEKESLQYIVNDLNSQLEKEKHKQQGRKK